VEELGETVRGEHEGRLTVATNASSFGDEATLGQAGSQQNAAATLRAFRPELQQLQITMLTAAFLKLSAAGVAGGRELRSGAAVGRLIHGGHKVEPRLVLALYSHLGRGGKDLRASLLAANAEWAKTQAGEVG
jgi:hypothetical protein